MSLTWGRGLSEKMTKCVIRGLSMFLLLKLFFSDAVVNEAIFHLAEVTGVSDSFLKNHLKEELS